MGSVALEGFGSVGGAALNFKVVGNPQPASPRENTIWLNTDVPIGAWYFSATQPENLNEGDVWFPVGTSSSVEFNALKKNGIQVYPQSAKQYVSGALVDVTAKSYQNGEWVNWVIAEIIVDGVINNEIGFSTNFISGSNWNGTFTQNDGYVEYKTLSGYSAGCCADTKINLTNAIRIELDVDAITAYTHSIEPLLSGVSLVVLSTNNVPNGSTTDIVNSFKAQAQTKTKGKQTLVLENFNLPGEYYIGVFVCAYGSGSVGKVHIYDMRVT